MLARSPSARGGARSVSLPAPMDGWVTNAPITSMKPTQALRMQNWLVREDGLHVRAGVETFASGATGGVRSLMPFGAKLFASAGSAIFDVSTATTSPASVVTGATSAAWEAATVVNPGGGRLVVMNGADLPRWYDGTTWRGCAITGVTPTRLRSPLFHMKRIFAVEIDTATVWYLPVLGVQGEARPIYVGPQLRRGGKIVAITAISGDNSKDANDQLVAVSDQGELVIYSGSDPDNADTWSHAGTWRVSKPVGNRPFIDMGGSLGLMTVSGLLPIPQGLPRPDSAKIDGNVSDPISQGWTTATGATGYDWTATDSLLHEMAVMVAPSNRVFVITSGKWAELTGIAATCIAETTDGLFFGTADGKVLRYGSESDDGQPVRAVASHAFARVGGNSRKLFHRARLQMTASHPYRAFLKMQCDYRLALPPAIIEDHLGVPLLDDDGNVIQMDSSALTEVRARYQSSSYWLWDDITWGMQPAQWTREVSAAQRNWRGIQGRATAMSLVIGVATKGPLIYTGTDVIYEAGGEL